MQKQKQKHEHKTFQTAQQSRLLFQCLHMYSCRTCILRLDVYKPCGLMHIVFLLFSHRPWPLSIVSFLLLFSHRPLPLGNGGKSEPCLSWISLTVTSQSYCFAISSCIGCTWSFPLSIHPSCSLPLCAMIGQVFDVSITFACTRSLHNWIRSAQVISTWLSETVSVFAGYRWPINGKASHGTPDQQIRK